MSVHQSRRELWRRVALGAARGLDPRAAVRRPLVLGGVVGAAAATGLAALWPDEFAFAVAASLWLFVATVSLGAALVEARARSLTEGLRSGRVDAPARRVRELRRDASAEMVPASRLRRGDLVLVLAGELVPADGVVVAGQAAVKAGFVGGPGPLVRSSGAERRAVAAGALVLSDWLILDVWSNPGEDLRERLFARGERARRSVSGSPRSLGALAFGLVLVALAGAAALDPWRALAERADATPALLVLVILACAVPTTAAALGPALDLAGFDRLLRLRVLASTARAVRAVEAAEVLLLERASVTTRGNCKATDFVPVAGVSAEELAEAAYLASLADETPEGRSVVSLAERRFGVVPGGELAGARFVRDSGPGRLAGVDVWGRQIRQGDADAVAAYVRDCSSVDMPGEVRATVQRIASGGDVSLVVADGARVLGVVRMECRAHERIARLRRRGVLTIMATPDTPVEAARLGALAGVDDFLAEATPEAKLAVVGRHQAEGRRVAMVGDGEHDAPALALADVSIASSAGPHAAREAGSLVDLDADPAKIIAVVEAGRQLRARRRTLYALAAAIDAAVCAAVVPMVVRESWPAWAEGRANPLGLVTPESAALAGLLVHTLALALVVPASLCRWRRAWSAAAAAAVGGAAALAAVKLLDAALSSLLAAVA